jgi:2-polyprenyl-3-methyl-5-hydroxy-6-metoxy-1,4-benzoquinol methylase
VDPPPLTSDEGSASFYSDYYVSDHYVAGLPAPSEPAAPRRSRFWRVAEQVPPVAVAGGLAVDIGCGEGGLCRELANAGWRRVVGLDVSSTRVARARATYPDLEFFDRPITQTGLDAEAVELAVMDNVIEHLPDPVGLLRTLREFMAPQGRLVVITPNMESGNFRLLGRRWTPELAPHAHVFLFTPPAMRTLLARAGFVVEAAGTFHTPASSCWPPLGVPRLAELKVMVWRAMQDAGGVYSRLISAGPMLYAVARRQ